MRVCLNTQTGLGCGAINRDGARFCGECRSDLRFAIDIHDPLVGGRYRILRGVGCGGYGAVYCAEDTQNPGTLVALKESFDPDLARSFADEFQVLHRLSHDNLPHYHAMFEHDGSSYLVMEFVEGQSLDQVLAKQGTVLERLVLSYADHLCDVVDYLHRQDPPILHRDIKPANIRITPEGLIKLVDFGLIKQMGSGPTRMSRRALTPPYAPPEQWTGGTSQRSDIYALGATFYHLLTGQEPPQAIDRDPSNDPLRPPHSLNARVSAQVSNAVVRAMALRTEGRYETATAFYRALRGQDVPPPPPAPAPKPKPAVPPKPVVTPPPYRPTNPLFPVTLDDWRYELARSNTTFGSPAGYWCYVRPGTYRIGGWEKGKKSADITLPGFWVAKHPITNAQYRQFMKAGGYANQQWWTPNGWAWKEEKKRTQPYWWNNKKFNGDNQPVVGITWYEGVAFSRWLDETLKADLTDGSRICLPTEAMWEAAAAYDAQMQRRTYPWGEEEPSPERAVYGGEDAGVDRAALVGERPKGAAACGAHDMGGNVWEMTASSYGAYPGQSNLLVKDFSTNSMDVPWRGGSWYRDSTYVRCAARFRDDPANGLDYDYGVRLSVSPLHT